MEQARGQSGGLIEVRIKKYKGVQFLRVNWSPSRHYRENKSPRNKKEKNIRKTTCKRTPHPRQPSRQQAEKEKKGESK